jgi:hypothetical protein
LSLRIAIIPFERQLRGDFPRLKISHFSAAGTLPAAFAVYLTFYHSFLVGAKCTFDSHKSGNWRAIHSAEFTERNTITM